MATERRRRSRDKRASRKQAPAATGPTSVHNVPDHVLELILLRLGSPACLLRAAASCKRWRRVVADAGFLSRYGSAHDAPCVVAGHYHALDPALLEQGLPSTKEIRPVFVPSSPSLAGVDARRFSLDFLPDSDTGWSVADSRGSLLLLFKRRTGWAERAHSHSLPDLIVCEPLTRRCQGILRPERAGCCLGVFLLNGDGDGGRRIGMSNFRVLAVMREYRMSEAGRCTAVACVFSSGSDGGWRVQRSASTTHSAVSLPGDVECIGFAGRANGSLYWVIDEDDDGVMLVFDEATMEFSRVPFPTTGGVEGDEDEGSYDRWSFRVIGGDDGAPRVVRMISNELMVLAQEKHHHGGGGGRWVVEKLVRLPEATVGLPGREDRFFQQNAIIVDAHDTYVLVTPQGKTWLFSVELETMRTEREHGRNRYAGPAYASELPWPPSFTACAEHSRRRR